MDQKQQPAISPKRAIVTRTVKLTNELNLLDWFRTTDLMSQIAERAKNSVDSVITTLDPGMKEYLFSGGDINIIVLSDSQGHISPIRDAFQFAFGRATVTPAPSDRTYPVKVANGLAESVSVAVERIKDLRSDTSTIPQNQVVIVIQPTLTIVNDELQKPVNGDQLNEVADSNQWFFSYAMILDDPVQNLNLKSFSQFIPIDPETILTLRDSEFPEGFAKAGFGFAKSIDEAMSTELKLGPRDLDEPGEWLKVWSGIDEIRAIHDLAMTIASCYKRRWSNNFR